MAENYNSPGSPVSNPDCDTVAESCLREHVVLGMFGIYLPGGAGNSPVLDVEGRVALGCYSQSQASQTSGPHNEQPRRALYASFLGSSLQLSNEGNPRKVRRLRIQQRVRLFGAAWSIQPRAIRSSFTAWSLRRRRRVLEDPPTFRVDTGIP